MPIRSLFRDGPGADPAECVLPNHFGNVRVLTLDLLELCLDHPHLVHVLDEALGTRVAADHALVTFRQWELAPRAALAARKLDVDERPRTVDRAPLADGLGAGRAGVLQPGDRGEAEERRGLAVALAPVACAQRCADRAGLAGVRMQHDLGLRHLAADE